MSQEFNALHLTKLAKALALALLSSSIQGCKPDIRSSNPEERIAAIQDEESLSRLSQVARADAVWEVRQAALGRITDDTALADIAIAPWVNEYSDNEFAFDTAEAAIKAIQSQEQLVRVAKDAPTTTIGKVAIEHLSDQPRTLDLALTHKDWVIRRHAVGMLSEDSLLARFCHETEDLDLALSGVPKMANQQDLEHLARTAPHWLLRQAAVRHLNNEEVISHIAHQDPDWSVRAAAVSRIEGQAVLTSIARKNEHPEVRFNAVSGMTGQGPLRQLAEDDRDPYVRVAAIHLITDKELLKTFLDRELDPVGFAAIASLLERVPPGDPFWPSLFSSSKDYEVQLAAVCGSDDQTFLARAAQDSYETEPRGVATKKLNDSALLLKLAGGGKPTYMTSDAIARLVEVADQETLAKIALGDPSLNDNYVGRESAISRITNQEILKGILRDDSMHQRKEAALRALTDLNLLEEEARSGKFKWLAGQRVAEIAGPEVQERLALDLTWPHRIYNIERLQDEEILHRIALEDSSASARRAAVKLIKDETILARAIESIESIFDEHEAGWIIEAGIPNIADQEVLTRIVLKYGNRAAFEKITDQRGILKALEYDRRRRLVPALSDEVLRKELATSDSGLRQVALDHVQDDAFLLSRFAKEPWKTTRKGLIGRMSNPSILLHFLEESFDRDYRIAAERRLWELFESTRHRPRDFWFLPRDGFVERDKEFQKASRTFARIKDIKEALKSRQDEITNEDDLGRLTELALEGEFDDIRTTAASRIEDIAALEHIALNSEFRGVAKIVLLKLTDRDALVRVSENARLIAVRLVALVKSGRANWTDLIQAASKVDAPDRQLGEVLGAISLLPRDEEVAPAVVMACHTYIRRGDESRIPDLIDLLELYGDRSLAEDYLNCGQPDLAAGAGSWARRRGYVINSGHGSARARWGSQRR